MNDKTLAQFLSEHAREHQEIDLALVSLLNNISDSCRKISCLVSQGRLGSSLGAIGEQNVHGETQKELDVLANDILLQHSQWTGLLGGIASEEMAEHYAIPQSYPQGDYLLLFDPLDGSSNIDVNVSVGTIFSILKRDNVQEAVGDASFLQCGRRQIAAGYAIYGPQTMLILTLGHGVYGFTLNPAEGAWILTHEKLSIPEQTKEFAINMSNSRHWAAPVSRYIAECLQGEEGPRGKNYNMRWIASMVSDVHRILIRGGVFMYPWDQRNPDKAGKLRLMYEANPMSFLVEQAGGAASSGTQAIMDIQPESLHQRVSVMLGSKEEIALLERYHQDAGR